MNRFGSWDADGDGKISAAELLSSFDADGDGVISTDELAVVSEQLTSQVEFTNNLLQQVQDLEENSLGMQRELMSNQDLIKKSNREVEESKAELNETKKKLKIAQEIADAMSKQCRESRVEAGSFKNEYDVALKNCQEGKVLLKDVMDERARLQRALTSAQSNLSQVRSDSEHLVRELRQQNDAFYQKQESLDKQIFDLRSQMAPIETEKNSLKTHVRELAQSLEETAARCEDETQQKLIVEKKYKDAVLATENVCGKYNDSLERLEEAAAAVKHWSEKMEDLNRSIGEKDTRLGELEEQMSEMMSDLQLAQEERAAAVLDLEHLQNDAANATKNRQQLNDQWAEKLATAKGEMAQNLEETKSHAEAFAMEAQQHAMNAISERQLAEEKYLALQQESSELHKLIQQMQDGHREVLQSWEDERDELEHRISDLQQKVLSAEDAYVQLSSVRQKEGEEYQQIIKDCKQESIKRGSNFLETLTILQNAVRSERESANVHCSKYKAISSQLAQLTKFCTTLKDRQTTPINVIKPELEQVFKIYNGRLNDSKALVDRLNDDLGKIKIEKEEEISNKLLLEDTVSKLEHEKVSTGLRNGNLESQLDDQTKVHREKSEQLVRDKAELEARLQRMHQTLEASTQQSRNLQISNQEMQSTLGTSSAKFAAERQEAIEKTNILNATLRRANQERDQQVGVVEGLKAQMKRIQDEAARWKQEAELAHTATAQREKMLEDNKSKHAVNLSAVGGTSQQYQVQLKQTQDILKTVQTQKAELLSHNQELRSQLASAHKQPATDEDARM